MSFWSFQRTFFLALILTVISIGYSFWQLFAFPDSSWPLDKGERVIVSPGENLAQLFTANRDGLRRVEILFGKFTLQKDDTLLVELRDSACSSVLAEKTLSSQSFDSEYTHSFIFNRIPNSKDQTYCLTFTFATNRPVAKDKAPRLFIDKAAQQAPYSLTNRGEEKITGTAPIAIRPGYTQASFFANADEFFDRISQYKPVFLKSWFLISFAVLGLALTFLVTALLIREEKE